MIKFFRNIRQSLLSEGKTSNYLKYAIGEIILVVIGILIALQVNNWNENRKLQKLELDYYQSLYKDLKQDSLEYAFRKSNAQRNIKKLNNILSFIDNDYDISTSTITEVSWGKNTFKDTSALWISISQAGFLQFPYIFENTITDLRATGNIKLLHNRELKDQLIKYYNRQKLFDNWNASYVPNRTEIDFVVNRLLPPEIRSAYNNRDEEEMHRRLTNYASYGDFINAISKEPNLKGLTIGMLHIQSRIVDQCYARAQDLDKLMKSVDQEIKILTK